MWAPPSILWQRLKVSRGRHTQGGGRQQCRCPVLLNDNRDRRGRHRPNVLEHPVLSVGRVEPDSIQMFAAERRVQTVGSRHVQRVECENVHGLQGRVHKGVRMGHHSKR